MTRGMQAQLTARHVASWFDASIVDQLRATGTPATIFLTGLWAEAYPDVVRSLAADPLFELANHSVDHAAWGPRCFKLTPVPSESAKAAEVDGAAESIYRLTGLWPRYFRFPGGCHSKGDLALVAARGEQPVGWDVNSGDAFQSSPPAVVRAVLGTVSPGSIIVMHLMGPPNAPATSAALKVIIPTLKLRGFEFVTLSTLLGDGAPARS